MFFIGLIVSFVILLGLIVGTVLLYMKMRERHSNRKVLNEASIIGFVFLASFALRLIAVLLLQVPDTVGTGVATGWYVLYSTIGGFSFEGVDGVEGFLIDYSIVQCIYYGAVVYAAITSLLIISVGISYELFSYVKTLGFRRNYQAFYIFTSVSEESLLLAQDINKQELKRLGKGRFAILFMGNELDSFDKKDEDHRCIMDNGFFYWSYGKKNTSEFEESILHFLHFNKQRCVKLDRLETHNKLVHIFALGDDAQLRGAENINRDIVFDDISALMQEFLCCRNGELVNQLPTIVNYYIATHGNINYQVYNSKIDSLVKDHLVKIGLPQPQTTDEKKNYEELANSIKKYFQIHILSEAFLTGIDLTTQLYAHFFPTYPAQIPSEDEIKSYRSFISADQNDEFHATFIGFGENCQNAMSQLFIATSFVKHNDKSNDEPKTSVASCFVGDIYDKLATEIAGKYAYAHPLIFCCAESSSSAKVSAKEWLSQIETEALNALYDCVKSGKIDKKGIRDSMGFPVLLFHNCNCFDLEFIKCINKQKDQDQADPSTKAYVIALGNDEENVAIANNIIDDFKHEQLIQGEESKNLQLKVIFVNVGDEKNIQRLNWSQEDKDFFHNSLMVIPFGVRKNLWTYQNIIDDQQDSLYNYMYFLKDPYSEKSEKEESLLENFEKDGNWKEEILQNVRYKDKWLEVDSFKKESNRSARMFGINYKIADFDDKDKSYYSMIEHLRWNRFHMVNGWIFAQYDKSEKLFREHNKEHCYLCPFELLNKTVIEYDTINIDLGKKL